MAVLTANRRLIVLGVIALMALPGCAGDPLRTEVAGARNTGTFPNLNIPPKSAATPISADEKAAMFGQIGAAQNAQTSAASATGPTTNPAILKKVADDHADETLRQIEGR